MGDQSLDFEEIFDCELNRVVTQRKNRAEGKKKPEHEEDIVSAEEREKARKELFGLALSGGGIRSASFGLGVIQALENYGVLKKIDYLSTVSGGGYIGSSLTWLMHKLKEFPFGRKYRGSRNSNDNDTLNFIRQHGNYLDPGHGLNGLSLVAVLLRSIFASLFVYFPITCLILVLFRFLGLFNDVSLLSWMPSVPALGNMNAFVSLSAALFALLLVFSVLYSWGTFLSKFRVALRAYWLRICCQKWMGRLLAFVLVFLAIGSLPLIESLMLDEWAKWTAGGTASVLGIVWAVFKALREQQMKPTGEGWAGQAISLVAPVALCYGLLFLAFLASAYVLANSGNVWPYIVVLASILTGFLVNLNYISLHRMYRDRLAETFLPDPETVRGKEWRPATEANEAPLSAMCTGRDRGPYHLINTNIILVDSGDSKYRGRGGDNFVLSPEFCGSDSTKWCATRKFMGNRMTLATAMAISGAAVNPHTGVAGKGPTRNWFVSFLMTVLNIGLGYWTINPKAGNGLFMRPDYFIPGLLGLFGWGFDENSKFIQLSDGGHFDNTGLYELIRRRAKVIVFSDGSADKDCTFDDLANAVERVRVDFGVRIKFDDNVLRQMLPGSAKDSVTGSQNIFQRKYDLARKGFAVGEITYHNPDDPEKPIKGHIYYVKTLMTEDLPADIYGYKSANPTFPDQSTTDQFFDETQFEAYRELGYQLAKSMLRFDAEGENRLNADLDALIKSDRV